MLKRQPDITEHAYVRAYERLGMHRETFAAWVAVTWRQWIPINAKHLLDRGVKCSAMSVHYIAAWDFGEALSLTLSDDGAIKTLYPYPDSFFDEPQAKGA
jgi:hypothetical protein